MRLKLLHSRILRNASALVATHVSARIIHFLYLLVIARLLGPEETGLFVYGVAFYMAFLGLANFGQNIILAQRLSRSRVNLRAIAAHSLTVTLSMAAILSLCGLTYIGFTEPTFRTMVAVGFFVVTLVFRAVANWVRGCFIALEQATWIPRFETLFRGAEALCGVTTLLLGGGLLSVCFLRALFWGFEMVASLRRLHRMTGFAPRPGTRRRLLIALLRVSAPITLGIWMLGLFAQVAIVILRQVEPNTALIASFGIAMQFVTVFLIPPRALALASLPKINRDYQRGGEMTDFVLSAKLVLAIATVAAICASAYVPWLIFLILGPKFEAAGTIVADLAWLLPSFAVVRFVVHLLNAMDGRKQAAAVLSLMVVLHIGSMFALLPLGAVSGAVLSLCVAAAVGALLAFLIAHKRLKLASHAWWVKPAVASAVAFGVFTSELLPAVWLAPIAVAALAAAMLGMNAISSAERSRLLALVRIGDHPRP